MPESGFSQLLEEAYHVPLADQRSLNQTQEKVTEILKLAAERREIDCEIECLAALLNNYGDTGERQ